MNSLLSIIFVLVGFFSMDQKSDLQKQTNNPIYQKIETYKLSCNEQNSSTCTKLADEYYTMRDFENSYPLYKKMCEKNDQEACRMKGESLNSGAGVPKDEERAFEVLKKSCNAGFMASCSKVGLMYSFGSGVKKDLQKSKEYYKLACDNGYAHGCSSLRQHYEYYEKNPAKIQEYFEKGNTLYKKECNAKNATSCYFLALAYKDKTNEKRDFQKAVEYFDLACEYGEDRACDGKKRLQEWTEKYKKMEKSCIAGDVKACRDIAYEYSKGEYVQKDNKKSIKYAKKACDGGVRVSCLDLAFREKGDTKIAKIEKLCDDGFGVACRNLAYVYMDEKKEKEKVKEAFEKGCKLNDAVSCNQIGK